MGHKLIWRFLGAYILLIVIALFILNFFAGARLQDYYELKISQRLSSNAFLISDILKRDLIDRDQAVIQQTVRRLAEKLQVRITVIDNSGKVLGDSERDPALMPDHSGRLEVLRAAEDGLGQSKRFSDTLGYIMKYVAVPVKDKGAIIGIVRLALPLTEVATQIRVIYQTVLLAGLIAIVFALTIGYFTSRSIVGPITEMKDIAQRIARGDFSKRANVVSQDELGVLARSLNKMADELEYKIESLKKADQIRTDFVANVSHELKTPLTSIKGFVETLENGALEDGQNAKRFIAIIRKHTARLSNILDDLLSLSELELSQEAINKAEFDLKDLVNEIVLGFGHALSAKKQELTLDLGTEPVTVFADRAKTGQALVNLIDNAIKYTDDKGRIAISLSQKSDRCDLAVEDNGIGIPAEHLRRVFERFYRVDKARSSQLGGTGLGLAIVKHITLLQGGDVRIDSYPDCGTKVTLTLPKK